jgi:hypothetical protein
VELLEAQELVLAETAEQECMFMLVQLELIQLEVQMDQLMAVAVEDQVEFHLEKLHLTQSVEQVNKE